MVIEAQVRHLRTERDRATRPGEWAPNVDATVNPWQGNGRRLKYQRLHLRSDGTRAVVGDGHGPGTRMDRIGKKATGRVLDGRTWDEYPKGTEASHG